jgi:hypothetical protein
MVKILSVIELKSIEKEWDLYAPKTIGPICGAMRRDHRRVRACVGAGSRILFASWSDGGIVATAVAMVQQAPATDAHDTHELIRRRVEHSTFNDVIREVACTRRFIVDIDSAERRMKSPRGLSGGGRRNCLAWLPPLFSRRPGVDGFESLRSSRCDEFGNRVKRITPILKGLDYVDL